MLWGELAYLRRQKWFVVVTTMLFLSRLNSTVLCRFFINYVKSCQNCNSMQKMQNYAQIARLCKMLHNRIIRNNGTLIPKNVCTIQ